MKSYAQWLSDMTERLNPQENIEENIKMEESSEEDKTLVNIAGKYVHQCYDCKVIFRTRTSPDLDTSGHIVCTSCYLHRLVPTYQYSNSATKTIGMPKPLTPLHVFTEYPIRAAFADLYGPPIDTCSIIEWLHIFGTACDLADLIGINNVTIFDALSSEHEHIAWYTELRKEIDDGTFTPN